MNMGKYMYKDSILSSFFMIEIKWNLKDIKELGKYIILNIKTKLNPSRAEKYALIWHIFP